MRKRSTAVVIRDGKVLLVRDKGRHHFSLPGGGIKKEEPNPRGHELGKFTWWDMKEPILIYAHVKNILKRIPKRR